MPRVTHRRTAIALAAGLVLSQLACTPRPRVAGPVAFTAPSTANAILEGKRQVVIRPVPSAESIVAVGADGRLSTTDGEAAHSLFVLTPVGDKHQIRTPGADASCMGVTDEGAVIAGACDSGRAGQLFTITAHKHVYAISNQGSYLQIAPEGGLIVDPPLRTTFTFVDNGAAG